MQIKTRELSSVALDWAVAQCEDLFNKGFECHLDSDGKVRIRPDGALFVFSPSSNWSQAGQIIEREKYAIVPPDNEVPVFLAGRWDNGLQSPVMFGPTPLIAAMRAYVASKIGDVVDVPEELV